MEPVNRSVTGSNPVLGAIKRKPWSIDWGFFVFKAFSHFQNIPLTLLTLTFKNIY